MKSGLTLTQLAAEIERRANSKKDVIVSTKNIRMIETPTSGVGLSIGDQMQTGINEIAHDQIGLHTEIPAKYYDKMREKAPGLLATNVNEWFARFPTDRMVRMLDNNTRAFLSNSYRPLENEDLAEAVLPPLNDLGLEVMSSQITDRRLYIKAVDKNVVRELKAKGGAFGDGQHNIIRMLAPAITISNSEVGEGALSILGGVYDGFCSNLATFGERSVRKSHLGGKHVLGNEEIYAMLSDETRRKTDAALWAQIGDVVRATFERSRFDALCDKIAETTEQKIEGDPIKVIQLTSRRFGLTEGDGKSVLKHLIEGGDLSRFGLYNAVTRAAQDIESYDRATDFERIGAQVIELPAGEWRELAKAA